MKLRDRLFVFSVAQLVVFGALFAVGYVGLRRTVFPMLADHLHTKAETGVAALAGELDLALGADDPVLIGKVARVVTGDPDLLYVEVRDAKGTVVFRFGTTADAEPFAGDPTIVYEDGDCVRAWVPVKIESLPLGAVSVAYSTSRIDNLSAWSTGLALVILVVWLVALVHSMTFARSFAAPIRAMMEFSQKVANGAFKERLSVAATGELHELKNHLNTMTADLESRELAQLAAAERVGVMQRELVAMSRMAGMAEVATGVLHNVGNVLNSLNVSISVVGDQLRLSKVASLGKSVDMFAAHPDGLAGFAATAKGPALSQFLVSVSRHLIEENSQARSEIASVVRNLDHIKAIVATQQTYAQVSGVRETIQLVDIVDDALKIDEASFVRHRIDLVRDYESDLPEIVSDRHRVLQIIVNLISNARQALQDSPKVKQLTVRLHRNGDGLSVIVADTGVGISAGNLARVFEHGFTTKKKGHGFGLHSSANTARELGGSLAATSEGVGCGATFTLELPPHLPTKAYEHN